MEQDLHFQQWQSRKYLLKIYNTEDTADLFLT